MKGLEGKYVQHWDLKYSWILFLLQDFKCEQQCYCNSRDFQAHLKHKCYCLGLSLVTLYSINFKQLSELIKAKRFGPTLWHSPHSGYLFESTNPCFHFKHVAKTQKVCTLLSNFQIKYDYNHILVQRVYPALLTSILHSYFSQWFNKEEWYFDFKKLLSVNLSFHMYVYLIQIQFCTRHPINRISLMSTYRKWKSLTDIFILSYFHRQILVKPPHVYLIIK